MKKSIFLFFAAILCAIGAKAFDQSAVDLYFDNSTSKWTECYVYIGHNRDKGWVSCYTMSRVSGTQYLWKLPANFNGGSNWGGATGWVVCKEKWWDSQEEDIYKFVYHGSKNVTNLTTTAWVNSKIYKADGTTTVDHYGQKPTVYKLTTSTKSDYKVTINTVTGGTLTVKDYDNAPVSDGASKIKLTVLKFSATPAAGYVFDGVQINDGSTTTTISAANISSETYTLTSNVTITPIWKATTSTVTVTVNATNGTVAGAGVYEEGASVTLTATPNAGYKFVNWTVAGAEVSKANPYTFTAEADVTVTANFEELPEETVYFINAGKWSKVHLHLWNGNAVGTEWPGTQLTATGEKIGEYDVYSYTAKQGNHLNLLFHENTGDVNKTTDLTWSDGVDKYYIHNYNGNTGWYTKAEAEEVLVVPAVYDTVYFVNNKNWTKVQAYAWNATGNNGWPGTQLTATGEKVAGFDVYSFEAAQGTYTNLIFNNKEGDAGVQSANYVWTADKYYYMGADSAYAGGTKEEVAALVAPDPLATDVYLVGQMNDWSTTANEFKKDAEDATIASLTLTLEEKTTYEFKVMREGDWTSCKDNLDIKETVSGLQFSSTVGDNCKLTTTVKGDYVFTWEMSTSRLSITYPASTPTALDNIVTSKAPIKVIENGQLFVIKNGVKYNVLGAIVK